MDKKKIYDAFIELRTTNNTIPSEVLDFMKQASLFVLHVDEHLTESQEVCCKICGKFISEIK